jgi:hypothetical protein
MMWKPQRVPSASMQDSRESFRPWGWAAVSGAFLLVMGAAAVVLSGAWPLVLFAPAWGYVLFRSVLTMCVSVSIFDEELTWRTVISSGAVNVDLAMSVRPSPGLDAGTTRIVDFADGQSIGMGEGPEFERLLRSLQRRVKDLEVHAVKWPI